MIHTFRMAALAATVLAVLGSVPARAGITKAGEGQAAYLWDTVPIGGGGYVIGIVAHPKEKDLLYIRTDVGGCYRWDGVSERWIPLLDGFGIEDENFYGVDGMAVDPNNPDVVYAAVGKYASRQPCDVLKSTDRGTTWTRTRLDKAFGSNGGGGMRWQGECLAVDPHNSDIVYCGTVRDGLWRSTRGAAPGSWEQVRGVQTGMVQVVVFDPNTADGGRTQTIYVATSGAYKGVMRSTDAGATWQPLPGNNPTGLDVASDGTLYASDWVGVFKLTGDTWTNISPAKAIFTAVSVDPTNPKHILASQRIDGFHSPIYQSTDGGATWRTLLVANRNIKQHSYLPWKPTSYFSAATSHIIIDPCDPKRAWFTDWYATWRCDDITADVTHWYIKVAGHEEIVALTLSCPSAGANVLMGVADVDGFRYTNIDAYPAQKLGGDTGVQETHGIDFCETQPQVMIRTTSQKWGSWNHAVMVSGDGGVSWKRIKHPEGATNGKVAISATDPNVMVYAPGNRGISYSTDRGNTWQASTGGPANIGGGQWTWHHALAADRVAANSFYAYGGGTVYRSTDGGATWEKRAALSGKGGIPSIKTAPGMAGEVWMNFGDGLHRSRDGGATFARVGGVQGAHLFAFGKAAPGKTNPAVFVYGKVRDASGIFRSDDLGGTWVRINDDAHNIGCSPNTMEGDRLVFGRVYIGTNGRGVYYGQPAETPMAPRAPLRYPDQQTAVAPAPILPGDVITRINVGSATPYTDPDGHVWAADIGFLGGGTVDRGAIAIAGSALAPLYRTERFGMQGYTFAIPNGTYTVRLHFAETYLSAPGARIFTVTVEAQAVAAIDVFKEAGAKNAALVKSVTVTVTDGSLDIAFTAVRENAALNGLEIIPG